MFIKIFYIAITKLFSLISNIFKMDSMLPLKAFPLKTRIIETSIFSELNNNLSFAPIGKSLDLK